MLTTSLLLAALLSSITASAQQEIKLTVNNIPNDKGTILIATKSGQWAKIKARKGKIETILHNVPEGKGTIYAFHDENDNKKLDEKGQHPSRVLCLQRLRNKRWE